MRNFLVWWALISVAPPGFASSTFINRETLGESLVSQRVQCSGTTNVSGAHTLLQDIEVFEPSISFSRSDAGTILVNDPASDSFREFFSVYFTSAENLIRYTEIEVDLSAPESPSVGEVNSFVLGKVTGHVFGRRGYRNVDSSFSLYYTDDKVALGRSAISGGKMDALLGDLISICFDLDLNRVEEASDAAFCLHSCSLDSGS